MTINLRTILLPAILFCALLAPQAAEAQRLLLPAPSEPVLTRDTAGSAAWQRSRPRSGLVARGALIGAGAGLAVTAVAAAKYGENEGGRFCGACMAQWSLVTVPLGAAIGAGIGFGIERSRRSVTATPMFSPRAGGVVISARF
jgi:hypothetical protein